MHGYASHRLSAENSMGMWEWCETAKETPTEESEGIWLLESRIVQEVCVLAEHVGHIVGQVLGGGCGQQTQRVGWQCTGQEAPPGLEFRQGDARRHV